MSTPSQIDIEALLAPIPGDDPAGTADTYAAMDELRELRREVKPMSSPRDRDIQALPGEEEKRANWPGVIKLAEEVLTTRSKDLRVAISLTEALTKLHGFAGLRDGLTLLAALLDQAWDRIHPELEDDEDTIRVDLLSGIDESAKGIRFPVTIRQIPIVQTDEGPVSRLVWEQMTDGESDVAAAFDRAVGQLESESVMTLKADSDAAMASLNDLFSACRNRMGSDAPSFVNVSKALEDSQIVIGNVANTVLGDSDPDVVNGDPPPNGGERKASTGGSKQIESRDQAYRQLAEAAQLLKRLEPHSPIPYLIEKAVTLGKMTFPDLIRELIRDDDILLQMRRELGLPKPDDDDY